MSRQSLKRVEFFDRDLAKAYLKIPSEDRTLEQHTVISEYEDIIRCERSLYHFYRSAWPTIEPGVQFVGGWAIRAICLHLMALFFRIIKNLLINVPPRVGKPLEENTPVLMASGDRKPLKEVKVGDYVITHNGIAQRVKAIHIQGTLPCLKITTHLGRTIISALDHPFLTPEGWVEAGDLVIGQALANLPKFEAGGSKHSIEEFRLAGYFVGDGCVAENAANIVNKDLQNLADIARCARKLGFRYILRSHNQKKGLYCFLLSRGVRPWLRSIGLAGKNSYTKRVPEFVFRGTTLQITAFLAAYFLCDGCISYKRKDRPRRGLNIEFSSVSRELLEDTQHLLLRLGIPSCLKKRIHSESGTWAPAGYISYRLTISNEDDAARFLRLVPIHGRKKKYLEEYTPLRNKFEVNFHADPIVSIESIGSRPCRCLTIEKDKTFIASDFVVHNSNLCSVCFPVWGWLHKPTEQWLFSSYVHALSIRDSRRCRDLIQSSWFQRRWGHLFRLVGDSNTLIRYDNNHKGYRLATSVEGYNTGEGAGILCFPYEQKIWTEQGLLPIGEIVESQLRITVPSVRPTTGVVTMQPIIDWYKNPGSEIIEVGFDDGTSFQCTPDHKICTSNRFWVSARDLVPSDSFIAPPVEYVDGHGFVDSRVFGYRYPTYIRQIEPAETTYCIGVACNHTFYVENMVPVRNCFDDPNHVGDVFFESSRKAVISWFRRVMTTRLNDKKTGCRLLIQQRCHEEDLSGDVIARDHNNRWVKLILPAWYEPERACCTGLVSEGPITNWKIDLSHPKAWRDPRKEEGELLCPERFGPDELAELREDLEAWDEAGQLQQRPVAAEGGTFKADAWQFYYRRDLPSKIDASCISVDLSFKGKKSSAMNVFQLWIMENGRFTLVDWRRMRVEYRVAKKELLEFYENYSWVDAVVIEDAANAAAIISDLQDDIPCLDPVPAEGNKEMRASSIAPIQENGKIFLPHKSEKPEVQDLLDEFNVFPNSRLKDSTDAMSQALRWLRYRGRRKKRRRFARSREILISSM